MKNIIIDYITETSFEDGTSWVSYTVGNLKTGYEIINSTEWTAKEVEMMLEEGKLDIKKFTDKMDISVCSEELQNLINECNGSDNEMWFVEDGEMLLQDVQSIEEEVKVLGIEEYFEFGGLYDDNMITVYGGIATQFLF